MDIGQKLTVNGQVMQDSRTTDMIHNVYELIQYGSAIITLEPGDVIAGGKPGRHRHVAKRAPGANLAQAG